MSELQVTHRLMECIHNKDIIVYYLTYDVYLAFSDENMHTCIGYIGIHNISIKSIVTKCNDSMSEYLHMVFYKIQ